MCGSRLHLPNYDAPSLKPNATALVMSYLPPEKGSLIFLKLGTLKVHVKLFFLYFDFWRENFLMGLKIDFEFFEIGQI